MKRIFLVFLLITGIVQTENLLELDENGEISFTPLDDEQSSIVYPPRYQECFQRGTELLRSNKIDDSIAWLSKAIKANPNSPQCYFNLAIAYESKNDTESAIEAYKDALLVRLDYPKAHYQLAKLLHKQGEIDEAIKHFEQAVRYDKKLVEPSIQAARLLVGQEKYSESIPHFERAVRERSNDIQLRFEYANTLNTLNRTEEALCEYQKLLESRPNDSGILYNTAYTLKKLGRISDAMPYYEATLQKNPNHAEAHFSLGLAHLANGDFAKGWPEYEWRWQRNSQLAPRNFSKPQWDGSALNGRTILIHAEQGLGDTFQFIRYARMVKELHNCSIIAAVQRPLHVLVARCCPYIDRTVTLDQIPTSFDVHIPLMSLPNIFKTEQNTVPNKLPYIMPDQALIEHWRRELSEDKNFKVGICWQGNSQYSTPFLRAVVAAKSVAMKKFESLSEIPGISFYSLQRETGINQLNQLSQNFDLKIFGENFDKQHGRFMDTAAVMKNLDLIITVDTSTSHLAGALGVPVWVMLPEPCDWRWMLKRTDTPWYPKNMRLFRQPSVGDWDGLFSEIVTELKKLVETKNTRPEVKPISTTKRNDIEKSNSSLFENELALINKKLLHKCSLLKEIDHSPEDKIFIKTLRSIHYLQQLKEQTEQKIELLES